MFVAFVAKLKAKFRKTILQFLKNKIISTAINLRIWCVNCEPIVGYYLPEIRLKCRHIGNKHSEEMELLSFQKPHNYFDP